MKRKKWTPSEKLSIIQESESAGVVETCRRHNLSTGTFYNWRKKYESKGEEGLSMVYDNRSKELKNAGEGIRILHKLLTDKEIELEIQRELLKKSLGPPIQERGLKKDWIDLKWIH